MSAIEINVILQGKTKIFEGISFNTNTVTFFNRKKTNSVIDEELDFLGIKKSLFEF